MKLSDFLFDVTQGLKRQGFGELDETTLKEVATRLQDPNVGQMIQSGQFTPSVVVREVAAALQAMRGGRSQLTATAIPGPSMASEADPRNLRFNSSVPMGQALGGVTTPLLRRGTGFAGVQPFLNDDQELLRRRRLLTHGPI